MKHSLKEAELMNTYNIELSRVQTSKASLVIQADSHATALAIAKQKAQSGDCFGEGETSLHVDCVGELSGKLLSVYEFFLLDPSNPPGCFKQEHYDYLVPQLKNAPRPCRCWLYWKSGGELFFATPGSNTEVTELFSSFDLDDQPEDSLLRDIATTMLSELLAKAEAMYR